MTNAGVSTPGRSTEPRAIAIIGAGYVGLPTAATLAHLGHSVVLADNNERRLQVLQRGQVPIVEDGLGELMEGSVRAGKLRFCSSAAEAVVGAGFVFLCVPTPQGDDGSADLSYVEAVAKEIAPHLAPNAIVVNKSTVPVGSAMLVDQVIGRADIRVVSNPEFLREGSAVRDSLGPDRVVVGGDDQVAAAQVGQLFAALGSPLIVTDTTTAETIKYASNAFLATKLSFVNAVAGLCEAVGADVRDVILGLGYDHRIGFEFLRPGPGWGGSCLPKDTQALLHIAEVADYEFPLLRGAIETNDDQLDRIVAKVVHGAGGSVKGAVVAVWGLTFKAGTDDRRCSPAVTVAQRLADLGARVQAFDPTVQAYDIEGDVPPDLADFELVGDPYEACRDAVVLAVLTEWDDFRWSDFGQVRQLMIQPVVVDCRNLLDPAAMRRMGFTYAGVGRG